jgi:hypothetical protein
VTKSSKPRDSASQRKGTKSRQTRKKSSPPAKRKSEAAAGSTPATSPAPGSPTRDDEAAFIESLVSSGQAARLDKDGKLPAGATHKIVEDECGNVKVVRRRFSIT